MRSLSRPPVPAGSPEPTPFGRQGVFAFGFLLLGFVLGDAALNEEAYAEAGYVLALLSGLGTVGLGARVLHTLRRGSACFWGTVATSLALSRAGVTEKPSGTGLPILLALLLLPLSALFAGLAGWVGTQA
ncbi:Hypothetical Protein RradSPS_0498 [Rubrobacter radiotolerans]|uniref:Uncharacterized protein n=1 Tax=Rubrobacter radiotolerans TaxID=42256 RepID=A0A023X0N6_RUBRA|nr:hypothetical protein [Rubrobacter radiotolerans]AHY45781.1 Hypothetical Protein RradSPS_0498 [Rubrobacter radiotolerans]MDX5893196.1 hypothetical protein [Rubrobacter radiotolerans]SMC03244.1 inner-membrane translocator [Rubrobacter radiotolerans DSM 5868]